MNSYATWDIRKGNDEQILSTKVKPIRSKNDGNIRTSARYRAREENKMNAVIFTMWLFGIIKIRGKNPLSRIPFDRFREQNVRDFIDWVERSANFYSPFRCSRARSLSKHHFPYSVTLETRDVHGKKRYSLPHRISPPSQIGLSQHTHASHSTTEELYVYVYIKEIVEDTRCVVKHPVCRIVKHGKICVLFTFTFTWVSVFVAILMLPFFCCVSVGLSYLIARPEVLCKMCELKWSNWGSQSKCCRIDNGHRRKIVTNIRNAGAGIQEGKHTQQERMKKI